MSEKLKTTFSAREQEKENGLAYARSTVARRTKKNSKRSLNFSLAVIIVTCALFVGSLHVVVVFFLLFTFFRCHLPLKTFSVCLELNATTTFDERKTVMFCRPRVFFELFFSLMASCLSVLLCLGELNDATRCRFSLRSVDATSNLFRRRPNDRECGTDERMRTIGEHGDNGRVSHFEKQLIH